MTSLRFRTSLQPVDASCIYRSGDSEDPRIGDICVYDLQSLPEAPCVVAILGVPQDIGVERNGGRVGAAEAPAAIRRALTKLAPTAFLSALQSGELALCDLGNIETDGKTLEQIHDEHYDIVAQLVRRGIVPIVLGGGHDCAWPTVRAISSDGQPYGVINIDAHTDVRPLKDGRAHSGSPFRQMLDMPSSCLAPGGFVEFGIQSTGASAYHIASVRQAGMHVMMLDDIRRDGIHAAWQRAMSHAAASGRTYVSVDMDAFASAYAPGVSAPAADGFAPHEVRACLTHAAASGSLTALDIVEVNPRYDVDGRTAKLAAQLIADVIQGLASTRGAKS